MSIQHISKPQPTLMGFTAWAFERLVKAKRQSAATVAAQIIEQWLDSSRDDLATLWNIRFEDWEKELEREALEEEIKKRGGKKGEERAPSSRGPQRISE